MRQRDGLLFCSDVLSLKLSRRAPVLLQASASANRELTLALRHSLILQVMMLLQNTHFESSLEQNLHLRRPPQKLFQDTYTLFIEGEQYVHKAISAPLSHSQWSNLLDTVPGTHFSSPPRVFRTCP